MITILRREWLRYRQAMGRAGLFRFIVIYCFVFGFFIPGQIDDPSAAFFVFAVIPLYISGPTAVDCFAGERERNTFETLVSSPVEPGQLLLGKTLFAAMLGSGVSWMVMLLFGAWRMVSGAPLPDPGMIPMVIVFGAILSILGAVTGLHVSVRARSVRSAMQWFSVVLLVVALGIPVSLRYLILRLPEGVTSSIGSLFEAGWYSIGTALLLSLIALSIVFLYLALRRRTEKLWFLNLKF